MIVDELKKSILNSVFLGKANTNNKNDENICDRIYLIKKEQEKLIKNKEIKIGKYDSSINYDEFPEIPDNWIYIKLGSISNLITKQTGFDYSKNIKPRLIKDSKEGYIPFLQTRDFSGTNFNFDTVYYAPIELTEKFPNITLKEKSLLLSIVGASIGNVGYYNYDNICILGGAIARIVLTDEELYDYLFWYLQSPMGYKQIMKNYKSTAQGTITVEDVRNIVVPLPPIEEQQRIVSKIEEIFTMLDEIKPIEETLNLLKNNFAKDMKKSVLNSLLSKYASNVIELSKIATINGGYAFKSSEYVSDGIRIIRISDFDEKGIKKENIVRYDYNKSLDPYKLNNENIIMCMTGGTVGKNILLENIDEDLYTNQRVATIKIKEGFIPKFVYYCLNAPFIQQMIQKNKNSTNDNISMPLIKSFPIPNISLNEQKRIVDKIEQLLPLCNNIENLVNSID